jgi:hypothetical protein
LVGQAGHWASHAPMMPSFSSCINMQVASDDQSAMHQSFSGTIIPFYLFRKKDIFSFPLFYFSEEI